MMQQAYSAMINPLILSLQLNHKYSKTCLIEYIKYMDSKTKVLLYLERNNSIEISSSGKIVSRRSPRKEFTSSRDSSIASANSSKFSRSSSPLSGIPESAYIDKFSNKLDQFLIGFTDTCDKKGKTLKKYLSEENKIINFLGGIVKKEISTRRDIQDYSKNQEFVRQAEKLARIEKQCESLTKENKAMKTLLAEMTISQVDAKINSSNRMKRGKVDVFTAASYIEKYSKMIESRENGDLFMGLFEYSSDFATYDEMIHNTVEIWIRNIRIGSTELVQILSKKNKCEQESRLVSEEAADTLIAEKEQKIVALEKKIQQITRKNSRQS